MRIEKILKMKIIVIMLAFCLLLCAGGICVITANAESDAKPNLLALPNIENVFDNQGSNAATYNSEDKSLSLGTFVSTGFFPLTNSFIEANSYTLSEDNSQKTGEELEYTVGADVTASGMNFSSPTAKGFGIIFGKATLTDSSKVYASVRIQENKKWKVCYGSSEQYSGDISNADTLLGIDEAAGTMTFSLKMRIYTSSSIRRYQIFINDSSIIDAKLSGTDPIPSVTTVRPAFGIYSYGTSGTLSNYFIEMEDDIIINTQTPVPEPQPTVYSRDLLNLYGMDNTFNNQTVAAATYAANTLALSEFSSTAYFPLTNAYIEADNYTLADDGSQKKGTALNYIVGADLTISGIDFASSAAKGFGIIFGKATLNDESQVFTGLRIQDNKKWSVYYGTTGQNMGVSIANADELLGIDEAAGTMSFSLKMRVYFEGSARKYEIYIGSSKIIDAGFSQVKDIRPAFGMYSYAMAGTLSNYYLQLENEITPPMPSYAANSLIGSDVEMIFGTDAQSGDYTAEQGIITARGNGAMYLKSAIHGKETVKVVAGGGVNTETNQKALNIKLSLVLGFSVLNNGFGLIVKEQTELFFSADGNLIVKVEGEPTKEFTDAFDAGDDNGVLIYLDENYIFIEINGKVLAYMLEVSNDKYVLGFKSYGDTVEIIGITYGAKEELQAEIIEGGDDNDNDNDNDNDDDDDDDDDNNNNNNNTGGNESTKKKGCKSSVFTTNSIFSFIVLAVFAAAVLVKRKKEVK